MIQSVVFNSTAFKLTAITYITYRWNGHMTKSWPAVMDNSFSGRPHYF